MHRRRLDVMVKTTSIEFATECRTIIKERLGHEAQLELTFDEYSFTANRNAFTVELYGKLEQALYRALRVIGYVSPISKGRGYRIISCEPRETESKSEETPKIVPLQNVEIEPQAIEEELASIEFEIDETDPDCSKRDAELLAGYKTTLIIRTIH